MARRMTLCPCCGTIQKADSFCSICGNHVRRPKLLIVLPKVGTPLVGGRGAARAPRRSAKPKIASNK